MLMVGQVDYRFSYKKIYMFDIFHLKGEREREREGERERKRERERERERQTDRERDRQTDRDREREA